VSSLVEAIEIALSNKDSIEKMSDKGKEDITTRFNWDKITEEYIDKFK
jgi:glycosyltransferase involved in cell wall biosynthesis